MNNKVLYRHVCDTVDNIPIFQQSWWLDAVCDDDWDVVIVKKGNTVVGALPYVIRKEKKFFSLIGTPMLTQFLGPWINYPKGIKSEKKLSFDKEIMFEIIKKMPKADCFRQNFSFGISNWLPFFWKGYTALPQYTYVIASLKDLDDLYNNKFSKNLRRDINKASKEVVVSESDDIGQLYSLVEMTYSRQKLKVPYSFDFLVRLDKSLLEHKSRKIFIARDNNGNVVAGIYIIWDNNSAYYLIGGENPLYRGLQAMSLLLWEGIKFSSTVTNLFDFEGSSVESIESFFKKYGAEQKVYFQVTKNHSKIYDALWHIRQAMRNYI